MNRLLVLATVAGSLLLGACATGPEIEPDLAARHQRSQMLLQADRYDEAADLIESVFIAYQKRLAESPPRIGSSQDDYAAGCAALLVGQPRVAVRWLADAVARHPRSVPLLQAEAIALFRRRRFVDAMNRLEKAHAVAGGAETIESTTFPERIDPRLVMMIAREYLVSRQRSGLPPASAAKPTVNTLIDLFPKWGLVHAARAQLLDELGQPEPAAAAFKQALVQTPWAVDVIRPARLFFVRRGDYATAYEIWARAAPMAMVQRTENQFYDRFAQLAAATVAATTTPDRPTRLALAKAYDAVGWTEEALAVVGPMPGAELGPAGRLFVYRLRAHHAFLERIRTQLNGHYFGLLDGRAMPDASELLAQIAQAGVRTGAIRFDPATELQTVLFAGKELFPGTDPDSKLSAYFRSHGQLIVMTQGWNPPVVKLMNLLYHGEQTTPPPGDPAGDPLTHNRYLGDEGRILSYAGFLANGPRIAGLTGMSATGFILDGQALRPSPVEYRRLDVSPDDATAPLYARAAQRLLERYASSDPDDATVFAKTYAQKIDKVAAHEFGHLVDLRHHLPIMAHLGENIGLALANGLSSGQIRARGERVAEASSLALATNPYMVMRDNLLWLQPDADLPYWYLLIRPRYYENQTSPYRMAGHALMNEIVVRAREKLASTKRLTPDVEPVLQLAKLTPAELRAIGIAICRENGLD